MYSYKKKNINAKLKSPIVVRHMWPAIIIITVFWLFVGESQERQ